MLNKLGLAECRVYSVEDTTGEFLKESLSWADFIVTQSPAGTESVALTVKYQVMGKVVVADYDDFVYSCSPFNPGYKTLGLKEVKVRDKQGNEQWLWKDGDKGFSIKDNYLRYRSQISLLGQIDGLTVTNEYLMTRYLEDMPENSIDRTFVLPNSIDFNLFRPFPKKENHQVRIGWLASSSHFNEAWMVRDIMGSIIAKYGDKVRFVILGDVPELAQAFKDKVEYHHFVDLSIYPLKVASLNLDIGICPLVNDEFNFYKSQLKWSEYSALNIASVVTDFAPYQCVEHGVTGLKAKNNEDFINQLCSLIENPKTREYLARNAFDKNYQDFNLEKNANLWVNAYESCHNWVREHRETPLAQC
jgi:glycosyltransferase involved in cell wall biosynthesis